MCETGMGQQGALLYVGWMMMMMMMMMNVKL